MLDQFISTISNLAWKLGSGFTVVFAWINTHAAACGFTLGVLGYLTSLHYQRKADARAERASRGE